ncbi:outer membrane protein transport protein [Psychrobacter fjordensis]|uniref:outer membrane protein transport protein n=1 Tax=Psychrobacter fjordensis TaxID=664424 RepID=UPI00191AB5B2|nr:outer membrane protein transport protein [Psychrobacter fjordensis]
MRNHFHLKTLAVAIATLSIASVTNAAGLDRSGQDVTAFFQDGTYAEAVYTYIDADVSGYDSANTNPSQNDYVRGDKTGDIAESYDFFRYGVKADINDTFSIGVLYDEPFGAAAGYTQSNFVSQGDMDASVASITGGAAPSLAAAQAGIDALEPFDGSLPEAQQATLDGLRGAVAVATAEASTAGEETNVEVRSQSLTGILGMKFGANKNFQIYGGPVAQRIQAETKLRGLAYGPASGYTSTSNPDMDYGYIAGIAYSKPEIALKAALTYRSEIEHNVDIAESYPLVAIRAVAAGATAEQATALSNRASNYEITTPKSVNFDFQTGINPTTLATAKVRWVPWSDFVITPPLYNDTSKISYGPDGLNLVEYTEDQWMVELGLAKRVAPALAISGTVGWDSGAGDPTTSLGPVEGYYSVGLGAKYNFTENWAVSAGGKYLWFGDAKGQLPSDKLVGDFQDNDGFIAGLKVSYQAK